MGKIETGEVLNLITTIPDTALYIEKDIIPGMMARRGRVKPLTVGEINKKIFNVEPEKPGEMSELVIGELLKYNRYNSTLTPELASEVADIVYYTSQTNCWDELKYPHDFFDFLGIDMEQARRFCILKYTVRMAIGDEENHKEIENEVLKQYLESQNMLK
jgi:hypothetical protein